MPKFARLFAALFLIAALALAQVHVRGYVRRDGTYVAPHYRSSPDGNFDNNWSTKGNVNPYTGKPGTRVTPPIGYGGGSSYGALRDYYKGIGPAPDSSISGPSPSGSKAPWSVPAGLGRLPTLAGSLPEEETLRSERFCGWLYEPDDLSVTNCRNQQRQVLASIVLPDYREFPQAEVARSGRYCEWLYGDNRASFYDCFNRQLFGLAGTVATFSPQVPDAESSRSKQYCEWLYGDNRASYRECLESQAQQLRQYGQIAEADLPAAEWKRAKKYCEWLYGENRGGVLECAHQQADALMQYSREGAMSRSVTEKARSYCEWLYGDNRASYWSCVAARQ